MNVEVRGVSSAASRAPCLTSDKNLAPQNRLLIFCGYWKLQDIQLTGSQITTYLSISHHLYEESAQRCHSGSDRTHHALCGLRPSHGYRRFYSLTNRYDLGLVKL